MKYLVALIPIIGASVLLWGADLNFSTTNRIGPGTTQPTNRLVVSNFHRLNLGGKVTDLIPGSLHIGHTPVFTNIVISNDYSGTIQIGSNLLTVAEVSDWFVIRGSMKRSEAAWTTTNSSPLASYTNYKRFTYTVDVANGLWFHTNVIDIHRCSEFCTRMRYVDDGLTNDFHAAFVGYTVKTNAP